MKLSGLLAAGVVLLASLPARPAPVPKGAKKANFFPLAVGNKWVYAEGDVTKTTEVKAVEETKAGQLYTLAFTADPGEPETSERVYRVEDGKVYSMRTKDSVAAKPSIIMRHTLAVGDEWTTEHQWTDSEPWTIRYKVGEAKEITVPAGRFVAFPVSHASDRLTDLRWYADGVGLVRKDDKDGKVVTQLKSFTKGK